MPGPGNILIKVGAEAGQAVSELSKVNRSLGETMTTTDKMKAGLKKAALPAAAALAAIGYAAVDAAKAAMEDASSQEHLAGVLERTTHATKAQVKAAEDYITKLEYQTGIADDELRPALATLATGTKNLALAQKDLGLAVDIAAASGKSLATVSAALAKGYAGNTGGLARLVPGLDKATLATKDMTKITAELADLTGGAAAEHADTAAGRFEVLQVRMQELKETLGASLIPVIEELLPILEKAATFAEKNTTAIKVLVGVVAGLASTILVANAALKAYEALQLVIRGATAAWTAAQWLLNAALSANPIGLVVVALAALGAALVIAYQHSQTFRNVVAAAMEGVRAAVATVHIAFDNLLGAATAAFNWIAGHWKLALFAFGPIGAAVYVISENFDRVRQAAAWAANVVGSAWTVGSFAFQAIANSIARVAVAFQKIENAVAGAIDAVRTLVDWLSKVHLPSLGKLGSIIGKLEAPAPAGYVAIGGRARGVGGYALAGAGGTTVVNVYGAVDPEGTARAIKRLLDAHERRQGRRV